LNFANADRKKAFFPNTIFNQRASEEMRFTAASSTPRALVSRRFKQRLKNLGRGDFKRAQSMRVRAFEPQAREELRGADIAWLLVILMMVDDGCLSKFTSVFRRSTIVLFRLS
jgi:hypothetical protein